jgi:hypothetical protein
MKSLFPRCRSFSIPGFLSILVFSMVLGGISISTATAESIATYGDCKPCPGTIKLEASEVRPLLDTAGMGAVRKITPRDRRVIKLDIDGKTPEGNRDSLDDEYEIVLQLTSGMVFIRSLIDRSYIHLVADSAGANRGGFIGWNPEMYLQAGLEDRFEQNVSIDTAWENVQKGHVYQWATNFVEGAKGSKPLMDRLQYAVKRLTQ